MNKISFKNITLPKVHLRPSPSRDWLLVLSLVMFILVATVAPILWTYFDLVSNYDAKLSVENVTKKSTINDKRLKSALEIVDSRSSAFSAHSTTTQKVVDPSL